MDRSDCSAEVTQREQKREFSYTGTLVLTLSVSAAQTRNPVSLRAQRAINSRVRTQVWDFSRHGEETLYPRAVLDYKNALANNFPFHAYEAVLQYETAFNQDCLLSLYRDQYEYTGGAHGQTVRASDTWSLQTGERLPLSTYFRPGTDYRRAVLEQILMQADANMAQNPNIYFEDYRTLIVKYFNPESYYLTPEGLAVYYQQYEIGPYSSGIIVFTIPYSNLNIRPQG
jgi:hypothetical protein